MCDSNAKHTHTRAAWTWLHWGMEGVKRRLKKESKSSDTSGLSTMMAGTYHHREDARTERAATKERSSNHSELINIRKIMKKDQFWLTEGPLRCKGKKSAITLSAYFLPVGLRAPRGPINKSYLRHLSLKHLANWERWDQVSGTACAVAKSVCIFFRENS